MKKTHKVVTLPTEKKAEFHGLILGKHGVLKQCLERNGVSEPYDKDWITQHLYIISDDEIKEGDWCMLLDSFGTPMLGEPQQYLATKGQVLNNGLRKVVATTDNLSIANHLSSIRHHPNVMIPQLPESFIQAYIKAYNEGKPITEVNLEMQVKEWGELDGLGRLNPTYEVKTRPDNTVIIHQSKMYTREEVQTLCMRAYNQATGDGINAWLGTFDKWIQDNL